MTATTAAAPSSAQIMGWIGDARRRRLQARALRTQGRATRRRVELAALIAHLDGTGRARDRASAAALRGELAALDAAAARAAARCVAYAAAHPFTSY